MRNRLIHAYYDVNLDTLWKTIEEDVSLLIERLSEILAEEDNP
jgi:uncharacterized protein with HEPN domain